jgi:CubicO group peptidase (beta-lactamase class C family)
MNRFIILFVTGATLAGCSTPTPVDTGAAQIKKVETSLRNAVAFTDDSTWTIESRMAHYGVPGVSIAVIKDNKIAWLKTYGIMDKESKEPVTTTTLFQAGSISKPVAAYGALHLVQEGKINLDENVNTYLKSWKLPDNEFTAKKKVALKHLVNHSGGLTVHGFWGYSPDLPVPTLVQVLDGVPPANSSPVRVDKEPEESFRYSGGGYTIMQQMMIDIEGKPFPQLMKEIVLQPLGMNNSTYDQPLTGTQLQRAATGYLPDGTMTKGKRHTYPEMAAAGLWTTAENLGKFAIDVQKSVKGESKAVLSKDMANKMLTPFVEDFVGLGLFLNKKGTSIYFGHGGWDEGFSSEMVAHKEKGYGVVVLTNSNHPDFISELINSVAAAYDWADYLKTYKKMDSDTTKFSAIRGTYFNGTDGTIRIYSEGNKLFLKYLRGREPFELFSITDTTYMSRDEGHGGNPVQFKTNPADGKLNCVFVEADKLASFIHPRKAENDKVPYEYLLAGDFDKALREYQALKKADPKDSAIKEENINQQGYALLEDGKNDLSKKVFRINIFLYPTSANAYDSYADACAKNGDKAEAIENYKKALKLDPDLKKTKKKLDDLTKSIH